MAPTCRTALPFASGAEMFRSEIPFTYIPLQLLSRRYFEWCRIVPDAKFPSPTFLSSYVRGAISSGADLFPKRNFTSIFCPCACLF